MRGHHLERKLTWSQDASGTRFSLHLPPAEAAVVQQALRAMVGDLDHSHDEHDGHDHDRGEGDSGPPKSPGQLGTYLRTRTA